MKVHFFILVMLMGCSGSSRNEGGSAPTNGETIEDFDISPNDRSVLLLYSYKGASGVFEITMDGRAPKRILTPPADERLSSVRYSPDGKKIVFVKNKKKSLSDSRVCLCDRDGSNLLELTHDDGLVTDAVFSNNGSAILYCSSKKYDKYNKRKTMITRESHGFDIYEINISDKKETQLTTLEAVGIDNLTEINGRYVLFHLIAGKKSGIFSFEKENPRRVLKIYPANGTRESNGMVNPGYAPDHFLLFVSQSELYAMDMSTQKADLIYEAKGGHSIEMLVGFHQQSRVLLKKFDEQKLTSLNTDGSDIQSIDIEFPE